MTALRAVRHALPRPRRHPVCGDVGSSADNALAESFNAALKRETLQSAARWDTAAQARLAVFTWITRYNTRRRHSFCGQQSPSTYAKTSTTVTLRPAA